MPDADWSVSRASCAKPTVQGGINVLGDRRIPTSLQIISVQNQLAVTHLGLVNRNTDQLYSVKDKHSMIEFFLFKPCFIMHLCSTVR